MVLSEILFKLPYFIYSILYKYLGKSKNAVFYCHDIHDYYVLNPVQKYLSNIPFVVRDLATHKLLADKGIKSGIYPVATDAVIMARHAFYKFPLKNIVKIGLRHGPYHFKRMISPVRYNKFDLFLFTSNAELQQSESIGIRCGEAVGYPKIDPLFDETFNENYLYEFKRKLFNEPDKKTIMFSATWNKSGMSAIERWFNKLDNLTDEYNIVVTCHPLTNGLYKSVLRSNQKIVFTENESLLPYYLITDLFVSDTSSIIAEFAVLDKPIITFIVNKAGRLDDEIINIISEVSFRVETFQELVKIIPYALSNPDKHSDKRNYYSGLMLDKLDGKAGERAANLIREFLSSKGIIEQ
ncbi:MAG: CDP-glycerol glycerophosphotransferase family protein [Melioribacteraceae bacterium]|nr:CDP-glycerol glycerophosphotransferase family protein [Melioribacteraceae bacterium]